MVDSSSSPLGDTRRGPELSTGFMVGLNTAVENDDDGKGLVERRTVVGGVQRR